MSNLFIKTGVLIVLTLSLFSCEQQADQRVKIDLSKMALDFENSNTGKEFVLLEYKDLKDLKERIGDAVFLTIQDSKDIILERKEVTYVSVVITFSDGKAVISKFYFSNAETKKLIEGYVLDTVAKRYSKILEDAGNMDVVLTHTDWPLGYFQLTSFSNSNTPQDSAEDALNTYLSSKITDDRDYAALQINVSALQTQIYGESARN